MTSEKPFRLVCLGSAEVLSFGQSPTLIDVINVEFYESKSAAICALTAEESNPFILSLPGRYGLIVLCFI